MLECSERSKGYRVYNTETQIVEESIHVRFDDKLESEKSKLVDQFAYLEITYTRTEVGMATGAHGCGFHTTHTRTRN
jgi:hypothetical protein